MGRDRFCHMAVFSYSLEDTVMTRSAHSAYSTRPRRPAPFSPELTAPAASLRAVVALEPARLRADCAVCGSPDIAADEAMHEGLWLLGECGRCGHRWTAGPFDGPLPAPARSRPLGRRDAA